MIQWSRNARTIDVNDLLYWIRRTSERISKSPGKKGSFEFEDWSKHPIAFLARLLASQPVTAFHAWNCQPVVPAHAYYKTCLLYIVPGWSRSIERVEECPSPSRKLSDLPITIKLAAGLERHIRACLSTITEQLDTLLLAIYREKVVR